MPVYLHRPCFDSGSGANLRVPVCKRHSRHDQNRRVGFPFRGEMEARSGDIWRPALYPGLCVCHGRRADCGRSCRTDDGCFPVAVCFRQSRESPVPRRAAAGRDSVRGVWLLWAGGHGAAGARSVWRHGFFPADCQRAAGHDDLAHHDHRGGVRPERCSRRLL